MTATGCGRAGHVRRVDIAFASATATPGAVSFTVDPQLSSALGGYTDANLAADVGTLHARGARVVLSVGGELGTVSVNDAASASRFATSVRSIMTRFGFDGVDIDLENGVNPTFMAQALHQVAAASGSGISRAGCGRTRSRSACPAPAGRRAAERSRRRWSPPR